jgi:Zn-dependent protease
VSVALRGRLAPHLVTAVFAACVAFVAALLAGAALRPAGVRVPWLFVALATGVGVFLGRYLLLYRRDGVALDDAGVRDLRTGVRLAWDDVTTLRFAVHAHELGDQVALLRYAVVEGVGGTAVAFCDKGPLARQVVRTPHGRLADTAESGILVALLAERLGVLELLPVAPDQPPAEEGASAGAEEVEPPAPPPRAPGLGTMRSAYGILPLLAKLVPKLAAGFGALGKAAAAGLKTFNLGSAAVSLGAYGLLFNWPSAAALVVMIAWHEYGHVHALRRSGVPVRGVYFVPLLGGAAVHEAPIADRAAQAYVALNGPLWGTYLTLAVVAAYYVTGQQHPWLAVVAALGAGLNLFNLLPILPLDGGRVLSAIAFSLHTRLGLGLAFGALAAGLVLAGVTGLGLLALLIGVGTLEFAAEVAAADRRRAFAALAAAPRLDFPRWHRLQSLARTVVAGQATAGGQATERAAFRRTQALLEGRPMTPAQIGVTVAGFVLLLVSLVVVIFAVRHIPGGDLIHALLR